MYDDSVVDGTTEYYSKIKWVTQKEHAIHTDAMKHAILILAHKNIGQLCRLVEYFKHDCDVFIHIDRKKVITPVEKEKILGFKQVKFISQEYDVNWGENQKKVKKQNLT